MLAVFLIYRNFALFLLQALIEVIISSDRQLFVRATILLGDLLHLVSMSFSKNSEEKYRFPINSKINNSVENAFNMMPICQCMYTILKEKVINRIVERQWWWWWWFCYRPVPCFQQSVPITTTVCHHYWLWPPHLISPQPRHSKFSFIVNRHPRQNNPALIVM